MFGSFACVFIGFKLWACALPLSWDGVDIQVVYSPGGVFSRCLYAGFSKDEEVWVNVAQPDQYMHVCDVLSEQVFSGFVVLPQIGLRFYQNTVLWTEGVRNFSCNKCKFLSDDIKLCLEKMDCAKDIRTGTEVLSKGRLTEIVVRRTIYPPGGDRQWSVVSSKKIFRPEKDMVYIFFCGMDDVLRGELCKSSSMIKSSHERSLFDLRKKVFAASPTTIERTLSVGAPGRVLSAQQSLRCRLSQIKHGVGVVYFPAGDEQDFHSALFDLSGEKFFAELYKKDKKYFVEWDFFDFIQKEILRGYVLHKKVKGVSRKELEFLRSDDVRDAVCSRGSFFSPALRRAIEKLCTDFLVNGRCMSNALGWGGLRLEHFFKLYGNEKSCQWTLVDVNALGEVFDGGARNLDACSVLLMLHGESIAFLGESVPLDEGVVESEAAAGSLAYWRITNDIDAEEAKPKTPPSRIKRLSLVGPQSAGYVHVGAEEEEAKPKTPSFPMKRLSSIGPQLSGYVKMGSEE